MRPKKISDAEMLAIVRKCLLEQGGSVSTQYIADQLGVSQATLFKRFGSKMQLLQSAMSAISTDTHAQELLQLLEKMPTLEIDVLSVKKQVEDISMHILQLFNHIMPSLVTLHASGFFTSAEPFCPEALTDEATPIKIRIGLTKWISFLQEHKKIRSTVHPESVAIAMVGAIQHRTLRIHILKDLSITQSDQEYIQSIVDVFWQGLDPENGTKPNATDNDEQI